MKYIKQYALGVLLGIATISQLYAQSEYNPVDTTSTKSADSTCVGDSLIKLAYSYLGKSYAYGASGPNSFDCSGFTQFIYSHFGIQLPHSSAAQALEGKKVKGGVSNFRKGDLVFFGGRRNTKTYGHVGIFVDADTTKNTFSFIHASHSGVVVSQSDDPYYKTRYIGISRLLLDIYPLNDSIEDVIVSDFVDTIVVDVDTADVELENNDYSNNGLSDDKQNSDNQVDAQPADQPVYHVIRSGDTLYSLARHYGTTVDKICQLNSMSAKKTLHIGKVLRVK